MSTRTPCLATQGTKPKRAAAVSPILAAKNVFYQAPPKFHSKADLFHGKLPIVQIRTPNRSPATTPLRAAAASHHTLGSTGTTKVQRSTPDVSTRRKLCFHTIDSPTSPLLTPAATENVRCTSSTTAPPPSPKPRSSFARPRRPAAKTVVAEVAEAGTSAGQPALPSTCAISTPMPSLSAGNADAELLAASILDGGMLQLLNRNAASTAAAATVSPRNLRRVVETAARKRLPSLFEQLLQTFQRKGSLRMPHADVIAAVLSMHLADEGMSAADAQIHLELLERAAPDWLSLGGAGSSGMVRIDKMCTGVRQRLDDVAHGYAHI
jgi:hypothetical protein